MSQIPSNAHKPRELQRAQIEELLALSEFLPPKDRVLIEQVLDQGIPLPMIARLYQRSGRQLHRQVAAIIKRLSNHMFRFVVLHMDTLPADTRLTAKYVVLHGLSQRETSEIIGTSLHQVRKHLNTVQAAAHILS